MIVLGVHHLLSLPAEGVAGAPRHGEGHAAVLAPDPGPHRLVQAPVILLGASAQRPARHQTCSLRNCHSGNDIYGNEYYSYKKESKSEIPTAALVFKAHSYKITNLADPAPVLTSLILTRHRRCLEHEGSVPDFS